MMKRN